MATEILSANDVISSLWSKNAPEKCRLGLTDTIVYERSAAARWYITGKTGEILKKRTINTKALSDRWKRIAQQNESPVVAIIRQKGNILKFLNDDAWGAFVDGMHVSDDSIVSVHCFVKSKKNTIFRNKFELKDKTGRAHTTTQSYTFQVDETDPESVTIFYEDSAKKYDCRAGNINSIMDLATHTVIRYLEMMLNIKVLKLSVDYVIDAKSQLWMLWTSDAKIIHSNQLSDVPGLPSGDRSGRMSWAGPKYFEAEIEGNDLEERTGTAGSFSGTRTSSPAKSRGQDRDRTINRKADFSMASAQIQAAASALDNSVLETQNSAAGSKGSSQTRRKGTAAAPLKSPRNIYSAAENQQTLQSSYPDPFKCRGDYCNVQMRNIGSLSTDAGARVHTVEKMFTSRELGVLRKNRHYGEMMDFGAANGPALAALTQKSIILARKERRGLKVEDEDNEDWRVYPVTPRQNSALQLKMQTDGQGGGTSKTDRDMAARSAQVDRDAKAEQDFQDMLAADKIHREEFTKSMSTYYEKVRVCSVCHKIYMVLDWARDVLQRSEQPHTSIRTGASSIVGGGSVGSSRGTTEGGSTSMPALHSSKSHGSLPRQRAAHGVGSQTMSALEGGDSVSHLENPDSLEGANATVSFDEITSRASKKDKKTTWRNYKEKAGLKKEAFNRDKFADLDDYLRGGTDVLAARRKKEKDALVRKRINQLQQENADDVEVLAGNPVAAEDMYRGKVLVACREGQIAVDTKFMLDSVFFDVDWVPDGLQVINDLYKGEGRKDSEYDCLLIERDCSLMDSFQVVAKVREQEKLIRRAAAARAAAQGKGQQPFTRRLPVICFTSATQPADLQAYMKADMDGCVSWPPNKSSLINTVRAAIPHHLASINGPSLEELNAPQPAFPKSFKQGILGTLEGSTDSATTAARQLVVAGGSGADGDSTVTGMVQIDADTRVPYMVMDFSKSAKVQVSSNRPFFNLVVCHDIFDTAEKMKIFFKPIAQKYLGMQILFWNYPGQAFTEWRQEQLLNNEYHATCLNEVMGQVGERGTKDFDTSRPFYMMGFGHGTSILSFYASHYTIPNMRGLLSINGWVFADSYLAGVMHDCINVFQAAPSSRPDLPVYFFSRFLFSKEYLAKVSVPLALNLYTAVHNPISLAGRLGLCKGVLHCVDVRNVLREIDCPVICIQSTQNSFARPLHTEPFVVSRGGEVRSIFKALVDPQKTCVIWMKSGHEVFQECRKQTQTLLEQILTGFHETNDVSFPPAPLVDEAVNSGTLISKRAGESDKMMNKMSVEDKFIDTVLDNLKSVSTGERPKSTAREGTATRTRRFVADTPVEDVGAAWQDYAAGVADGQILKTSGMEHSGKGHKGKGSQNLTGSSFLTFDASSSMFEKQESQIYNPQKAGKGSGSQVMDYPEVKEYMGWRLKRNKKRLQRLQGAARAIQGAFRAHIARQFVRGIRRRKAAMVIQRSFRGWLGRCSFLNQARRIWGTLMIQRAWRGYLGRKWFYNMRLQIAGAATIQRLWRGYVAREFVKELHHQRYLAVCRIQSIFRRNQARRDAWRRRERRNASTAIQRVFRGHLGRRKAIAERDRYIFSKSQSQGIEFGRQMLLEHKLHATRLQSDVTLLTQEKSGAEEQVEALLEEITSFEEGVRILEKEMHQLSKVEVEAASYMDEESKYELREQKMRLDREFGDMLSKIGNRKDMLADLEVKLSSIDKARQMKEEELRTLERKLVVLLEEQQNELRAIKRKQDVRGALLAASHEQLSKATAGNGSGQLQITNGGTGSGVGGGSSALSIGGGGYSGPSMKEKQQAAQLMQSTETLMKFGFMSMSMTYFSSINMVKAMRTVSAQDTVMAALADSHSQKAANAVPGADGSVSGGGSAGGSGGSQFLPALKKGEMPGQESLHVSSWSVEDVARWLQTLALGQYSEAFIDAAVDGEFLYDLNDDDLKNTLGVEHRLHRKKILNCVHRLKIAEAQRDSRIGNMLREMGTDQPQVVAPDAPEQFFPEMGHYEDSGAGGSGGEDRRMIDGPKITLEELFSLVRHSKYNLLKEALDYLPNRDFDSSLVRVGYIDDFGTAYSDGYEKLPFHINKTDEFGNTMLTLACQNGNMKVAKYLMAKGSNPNHQNLQGQTPAHYCIAYQNYDLSTWLFENGASDTCENKYGLTPYDGLSPEG